jgi:ribose-phosphate pyrophosphokinase
MDLHAGQIQGFFNIPVDNLFAAPVMIEYMKSMKEQAEADMIIVSPDAGGVERARAFAKRLGMGLGIVDKRRDKPNQARAMNVIGDVQGKRAVIVDDMVDTAGTLTEAASAIMNKGATEVHA